MKRSTALAALALLVASDAAAQRGTAPVMVTIPSIAEPSTPESARRMLTVLAADSMEGRAIWKPGADKAARYIAQRMQALGLVPAGDSGYFQRIYAIAATPTARPRVVRSAADLDTVPVARRRYATNVIGILPRRQAPADVRPDSVIVVGAHYDHMGIGTPVNGDSIYNGADDDASGVVAMLEMARMMKSWPAPGRTVVFAAFTGEESGFVGTNYYIANPARPIASMAADFQIEMIGRPDSAIIGPGRAWLTGYERSTMGETFQRHGLAIVPDSRPSLNFFNRSDNAAFARAGIPAHTLSSFNLHSDYHQPSDDVSKVDFDHMSRMINIAAKALWVLTEGPAPRWFDGQRPCPPSSTAGGGRGRGNAQAMTPAQADSARRAREFPQPCTG